MLKIILYDVIPSKNKGEFAILIGIKRMLDALYPNRLVIVSREEDYDSDLLNYKNIADDVVLLPPNKIGLKFYKAKFFVELFHFLFLEKVFGKARKVSHKLSRFIVDSDVVLYGHDNMIGTKGFSVSIYLLSLFCNWSNKPIFFCCGSVGPFNGRLRKYISKKCLDKFDIVSLRDLPSYKFVESLGVDMKNVHLTIDPAFLMPPADNSEIKHIFSSFGLHETKNHMLGISVTEGVVSSAIQEEGNPRGARKKFLQQFVRALERFLELEPDVRCIFIPHGFGQRQIQDDRLLIREILRYFSNEVKDKVYAIYDEPSPQQLKRVIGTCELFVGMRTHALIAALSMATPSIALSNKTRNKTNGIFGDFFEQHDWIYYCEFFDQDEFLSLMVDAWKVREISKEKLEMKSIEANEKAMYNARLIEKCIQRYGKTLLDQAI